MKKYIAYLRVSTKTQGMKGLGMDAQKQYVRQFLAGQGITKEPEYYIEVETGKIPDRKELKTAISRCKETGSTLLIAKLDRLSRNVVFIFTLRDELRNANVDFMALDLPDANTLTLGIMASFAQHEAERISQRTKDGLNAIKANIARDGYHISKKTGEKITGLGNLNDEKRAKGQLAGNIASCQSRRDTKASDPNFIKAFNYARLLAERKMSVGEIARELNRAGYRAPRGGEFIQQHISRLLKDGKKLLNS